MQDVNIEWLAWRNDLVAAMAEGCCDLLVNSSAWQADHAHAADEQVRERLTAVGTAVRVFGRWIGKSFCEKLTAEDRADGSRLPLRWSFDN